jgi:hypothetical protein
MKKTKLIVNGLFHHEKGILLQKRDKNLLQLPGLIVPRQNFNQISSELNIIENYFFKIFGSYFWVQTAISYFHFTSKGREVRTYLINLSDEYEYDIILPDENCVFVSADIETIKKNRKILSDDKKIIINYLKNARVIQNIQRRFLLDIKAIA